jgi:Transposase zinc-binding domain/Putative transposase
MAPAVEVADIFRHHGEAFRQAHAGHLGRVERRVMGAITACRTAALGGHVEQCDDCGTIRIAYNSCRNRHCPKCQGLARAQWLANRRAELLPVPYFHLVFTLPAPAGEIAFQNKAVVYAILFRTAAETLATIAADPRHLGAQLGVIAVLHTWGQTLQHHPHVHCVVPGGGPSLDGTHWVACQPGFFLPVRVLSRLFRRLFLQALQNAFNTGKLRFFGNLSVLAKPEAFTQRLGQLRRIDWVVFAKPPFGRWARTGAGLSRPLHPSRRHRQQPADLTFQRQGPLHLEGLSSKQQEQADDARCQRVHPPLSSACPARRFPSYPATVPPACFPSQPFYCDTS